MWTWIIVASLIAFATKYVGYLVPESWLERRRVMGALSATTIGLLAALVAINSVTRGSELVADSRLLAVIVAVIAMKLRVPFLIVVVLGALAVALGRLAGLA